MYGKRLRREIEWFYEGETGKDVKWGREWPKAIKTFVIGVLPNNY